ncbi:MAG TPA: ABC transporter permease [Candidatus Competibacteraceae bacterium]|nr:ABC transporter permease [Candidatus Competibacteraceae bacterium]
MNWRRFWAVFVCRNREFLRDRSTLTWNLLFPVSLIAGFAFAFSGSGLDLYKVGVLGNTNHWQGSAFFSTRYIHFIPVTDRSIALSKVERHQLDMLIDPTGRRYWINDEAPKGYVLEQMLRGVDATTTPIFSKQTVSGRGIRYVDWVMPGVLAMNMMFGCLFGVGYVIVRYRKNGMLKRLKATPLTPLEFLAAQVTSRLWLTLATTIVVFAGTDQFIVFPMHGSYLDLFVVFATGAISLISLGLIVAARTTSEELAAGLLNLLSWPMTFLSGVWFSLEGVHPFLQQCAQLVPLTHIIDAARAIMMDGAGLGDISGHLLALMVMSLGFMAAGAWLFRWE